MELKELLKCRVTLALLISWLVLSVIGYIGKDTVYSQYTLDVRTTPYFVLVFEGIQDGIYPWSRTEIVGGESEIERAEPQSLQNVAESEGNEAAEAAEADEADESVDVAQEKPKVIEFVPVDENYFDDAVFIGDSRTVGLHDYGGLDSSTFYATVGLNIYDLWTEKFCEVDGVKVTLEEALSAQKFGKIYFQIGINEMGRGTLDGFIHEYQKTIDRFKVLQPDAVIYVQGIMRVTQEKSDSDAIFNNPGIQLRNERIAQLADNVKVFYIDMNEVVCDQYGNLKQELTFDNLHLYGSKYGIWVDFLKTKGIGS